MICEEIVLVPRAPHALAGRIFHDEDAEPGFLALVAPPHPLLGGTPDNPALLALANGCAEAGGVALTWEYGIASAAMAPAEVAARRAAFWGDPAATRGYVAELAEARDCVAWMRAQRLAPPDAPVFFAGYSFGGALALLAAPGDSPVLAVSAPIGALPRELPVASARMTLAWPRGDVAASDGEIEDFARARGECVRAVVRFEGDDHFLRASAPALRDLARDWAAREARQSSAPASIPHASILL